MIECWSLRLIIPLAAGRTQIQKCLHSRICELHCIVVLLFVSIARLLSVHCVAARALAALLLQL